MTLRLGTFESVIGLEVHAELLTASKIFCGCSAAFGAPPNQHTCPVCLGMPGMLPVLNRRVVEFAVRAGLATHSKIAPVSRWARKNYFYPDLCKGYQISQYELPICEGGHVDIVVEGVAQRVRLTRIHMEEDTGKNIHDARSNASLVDFNRSGVPLLEIVSEPDMTWPAEAVAYLRALRSTLQYLQICDGNMEEGSFRCDANVSVRPEARRARFVGALGLPDYDADVLTARRDVADYFEAVVATHANAKAASNWVMGDILRLVRERKLDDAPAITDWPVAAAHLAELIALIDEDAISGKIAKTVFEEMVTSGETPRAIVARLGLTQVSDEGPIIAAIDEVLAANAAKVAEYRSGKDKLYGFFVGQVMKATAGKANPGVVNRILAERLKG